MARLQFAANTKENNESLEDFSAMPAGDYIAQITKSEYKETKAKNGNYLQLIWKVVAGPKKGRTIFDNLNLDNPNPIAVEIANKSLNSICKACQKIGVQDSEELHGIPCVLSLTVTKETATQPAGNNIRGYKPATPEVLQEASVAEGSQVDASTPPPTQNGDPGPAAGSTPPKKLPWE